jgi:N-acetyltransferase
MMKLWDSLFHLTGKTVDLIAMENEHLEGLWKAAEPDEIWTYMASKIRTKGEMRTSIHSAIIDRDKGVQYPFVIFDKVNGRILGSTRYLDISVLNKSAEIGSTWYHPEAWRTRVNTECKLLLLEHAFEKWELTRVQLKTDSRNLRSQAAIARLGAVREGVLRQDRVLSDGFVRDTVYYSILREEWAGVKSQLMEKWNR